MNCQIRFFLRGVKCRDLDSVSVTCTATGRPLSTPEETRTTNSAMWLCGGTAVAGRGYDCGHAHHLRGTARRLFFSWCLCFEDKLTCLCSILITAPHDVCIPGDALSDSPPPQIGGGWTVDQRSGTLHHGHLFGLLRRRHAVPTLQHGTSALPCGCAD